MNAVLLILSAIALAAYACRVDRLTWGRDPGQMLVHVLGGGAAAWAFAEAMRGNAGVMAALPLLASSAWLAASYRRFSTQPKAQ